MNKTDLKSMNLEEMTAYLTDRGYPRFRAGQLYQWIHCKLASDWETIICPSFL